MSEPNRRRLSWAAIAAGVALLVAALLVAANAPVVEGERAKPEPQRAAPLRVVSLNPSLTAILLALGAGDTLVGVDSWSHKQQPEVAGLPEVGGLFDPSLEGVVALEPDLVVLVPSVEQRDFRSRLESLGIRVAGFENIRFGEVLANILDLGSLVERDAEAEARVAAIRATRVAVADVVALRERVRCLVVLQRDPAFVVGGANFIDEMLETAGCQNLGRALGDGYPRAALEWIVAQAPEVVIDTSSDAANSGVRDYWQRWRTLPAVRSDRVLHIDAESFTLPGPALDQALRELVRTLHGADADAQVAATLERMAPVLRTSDAGAPPEVGQ